MANFRYDNVLLDIIETAARNVKAQPLNLGGISGLGGGVGGPPGGFIGWLPQTRVAYDEDEVATDYTPASGMSLLDNLNHIRYRISVLESGGSIGILDANTSTNYADVNRIVFSGAGVVITDLGAGDIGVAITATGSGGGDSTYLRLDTTNGPLTGGLGIDVTSFPSYSPTPFALDVNVNTGGNGGGAASFINLEDETVVYAESDAGATVLDIEQFGDGTASANSVVFLYRTPGTTETMSAPLIWAMEDTGTGTISGPFIKFERDSVEKFRVDNDGKAYTNGSLLITDAPSDGNTYGRNNGAWVVAGSGSGGAITVEQFGGAPSVYPADKIIFSGLVVSDLGSGDVQVSIATTEHTLHVYNEDLTTQVVSTVFYTTKVFMSGTVRLYYNGIRQRPTHFYEDGSFSAFHTYFTTYSGDSIVVDYDYLDSQQSQSQLADSDGIIIVDSLGDQLTESL